MFIYLILAIIFFSLCYVCAMIFLQVEKWICKNVKNVIIANLIRVVCGVILVPIPFIFLALTYIIGHSHFNKDK